MRWTSIPYEDPQNPNYQVIAAKPDVVFRVILQKGRIRMELCQLEDIHGVV